MQNTSSFLCKSYQSLCFFASAIIPTLIVGGFLSGCTKPSQIVVNHKNPPVIAPVSFQRVWLPLQQQHGHIIAVGKYRLPQDLIIPTDLKPFSSALVHTPERVAKEFVTVEIFFPSAKDRSVLKWAQTYPTIVAAKGRVQWKYKRNTYTTNTGVYKNPPAAILSQWLISGEMFTGVARYGVNWYGSIPLTKEERTKSGVLYDTTSPVRNEPHLVSMSISYDQRQISR